LPRAVRLRTLSLSPRLELKVRADDYYVLLEVLALGCYDVDFSQLGPIRTVLDLGANIGTATVFLSDRLPEASFVCVEPSKRTFEILQANLERNVADGRAVHAAVTGEPSRVIVREGSKPVLTHVEAVPGNGRAAVRGMTIPQILDEAGWEQADLVKVDIEGGERELFELAGTWASRVGAVLAEIHPPLSVTAAAEQLREQGFERHPLPSDPKFATLLMASRS